MLSYFPCFIPDYLSMVHVSRNASHLHEVMILHDKWRILPWFDMKIGCKSARPALDKKRIPSFLLMISTSDFHAKCLQSIFTTNICKRCFQGKIFLLKTCVALWRNTNLTLLLNTILCTKTIRLFYHKTVKKHKKAILMVK